MKATLGLKFLTVVLFLVTGQVAWGQQSEESKGQCMAACRGIDTKLCDEDKSPNATADSRESCRSRKIQACYAERCEELTSKKDTDTACTEVTKEWKTAVDKASGVCDEYEAAAKNNSCENRVKACEKKIADVAKLQTGAGSTLPGQINSGGGVVNILSQYYGAKNGIDPKTFQLGGNQVGTASCLKWSNDAVDAKKEKVEKKINEIDEKIKTAKKDITDLEKEMAKENESLRKETATLDEEKEKVQTTFKENVAKLDVKKREKYTALNKTIQDNLVKVRNLTSVITKRKEDLEKMKFEYAQRMVAFAEDKLESLCRVEVDKARSCFVRASKGEKFPPKDPCEGFTPTGKGVTGTSVMVKRLNQVRDACFEQANQAGDKARYDHASAVKNIEQDIIEKQNQIKDLNTNINLEKQEFDAITKENETEKTNETASTDQKQGNLAEKLNKLKISTEEKLVASKKRIDELNLQIEELVARKMPGRLGIIPDSDGNDITVAHREAKKAVEGLENARNTAFDKCGCEAKLKANKNDPSCLKLKKSFSDKDGGGIGGKSRGTN